MGTPQGARDVERCQHVHRVVIVADDQDEHAARDSSPPNGNTRGGVNHLFSAFVLLIWEKLWGLRSFPNFSQCTAPTTSVLSRTTATSDASVMATGDLDCGPGSPKRNTCKETRTLSQARKNKQGERWWCVWLRFLFQKPSPLIFDLEYKFEAIVKQLTPNHLYCTPSTLLELGPTCPTPPKFFFLGSKIHHKECLLCRNIFFVR